MVGKVTVDSSVIVLGLLLEAAACNVSGFDAIVAVYDNFLHWKLLMRLLCRVECRFFRA